MITQRELEEIEEARSQRAETRRKTVQALEEIVLSPLSVLDHGFVRVVDYMGDDSAVVQAARVSYGRGTTRVSDDRNLIRYLMRHSHTTPFEMAEIKLHVKLPIFVARQWIRHRTASVNEYSARYSIMDKEFYLPDRDHLAAQSSSNRQGRGEILSESEASYVLDLLRSDAELAYRHYIEMLNQDEDGKDLAGVHKGIARELARMNLSLNFYTQWYWKTNLHNLMHFLRLRIDPHAQYEIRAYADSIMKILQRWVPLTYEAFLDYRVNAVTLSQPSVAVISQMLRGEAIDQKTSGLSRREWDELMTVFSLQSNGD
jgi:thymidylate synthase (FAD)